MDRGLDDILQPVNSNSFLKLTQLFFCGGLVWVESIGFETFLIYIFRYD